MILLSLPIMITSFGYNLLIPSLKFYLLNNKKYLIISILIGSIIPLIVYIIWEYLISTIITTLGNKLFIQVFFGIGNPNEKLIILLNDYNKNILYAVFLFSISAIISSLIGVTLNVYDFFFDLLKSKKNNQNKIIILILVFCIPLTFNLLFSYIFMIALNYAAIFGIILLIIFPIFTLWYGRYIKKIKYNYLIIKSEIFLFFILFFGIFIISVDILEKYFIN